MLMSFQDISHETGSLCLVPSSHKEYREGVGHGEVFFFLTTVFYRCTVLTAFYLYSAFIL